jgi:hypothetical protein
MNATKQIIDILTACGCKPTVTTDERGNDQIKINAPALEYQTLFDSDAAENDYMIETGKRTE